MLKADDWDDEDSLPLSELRKLWIALQMAMKVDGSYMWKLR